MGNLTSYEVNLDEFNIEDPTPLDANQKMALDRGRDTGRLDFSLHSLTDIPIQVFDLSSTLTILNLSVNKLKFLPASLWEMTKLESLDISSNELESLPPQVEQLTNLQVLNLRHNFLTTLPASLGRCVALQKLNLEYNRLKTLPSLEALTDLRDLRLKYNQIAQLPPSLGAIKGCLDLQNNYLVEPPVCDSLTELLLENNSIAALPRNVDALAAVTRLTIANNRIKRLPAQIQHLKVLTELDLRENDITEVPIELAELPALKRLNLSNNKISSVPPELWTLKCLQVLNLGANMLEDLPPGIQKLTTLKELLLGGNRFTELPRDVTSHSTLTCLILGWNQITRIDPSISSLVKLSILHLTGNRINELPKEIGQMRCLKELYLAGNELTVLPETLCEMKGLELIDARHNKLCYLPPTLKSLNFLEKIDLGDNPSFPLPPELFAKKTLTIETASSKTSGRYSVAKAEMKGKRWTMEDAVVTLCGYRGNETDDYLAVFDGHGGDKAAQYAAKRHHDILEEQLKALEAARAEAEKTAKSKGVKGTERLVDEDDVIEAIKASFIECSREMTHDNIKKSGTTAVVTVCLGTKMYVANVGDSRAVIYKDGQVTRISLDHKPDLPEEEKRIRNLGGFVSPNGRVVGMLAVSRAFGDLDLQPFISADPYVDVIDIADPPDFLILACDGVWDVISDEAACRIVASESDDILKASMKLRDYAYLFGSQDNISVIIVKFK